MPNLPAPFVDALKNKSLASKFSHGRFDKGMKVAAERQFAEQAIIKNPELLNCTPASIATSLLDVSYSGLSLSPSLGHGYLIPYGPNCTFSPGYRGLMHLAYKAGTVKSIQVNLVYSNDTEFRVWTDEHGRHLMHNESSAHVSRGTVTHAYCIANLTAGGPPIIEVMNAHQISLIEKAATKRRKGGMVWRSDFRDEMCKKAVIRRASKFWPKDSNGIIEHMISTVDNHDGIEFDVPADSEAPEQEMCISLDQQTALTDVLLDAGVAPDATPVWLRRYAEAVGYNSIENLPARKFEEAKKYLKARTANANK